jgi:hypothetical protein
MKEKLFPGCVWLDTETVLMAVNVSGIGVAIILLMVIL